jgi:hypothetical protein
MVTGITVPHETALPLFSAEFANLADYQHTVGGYIEIVRIHGYPLLIVADEEGKVRGLPINKRATCLWWLLNPNGLGGDVLVGDVVIVGAEQKGELTDAPRNLVALLLETVRYRVEVRVSEKFDSWTEIGDAVDDFFEAALHALSLMEVWNPPGDVRVVAAI